MGMRTKTWTGLCRKSKTLSVFDGAKSAKGDLDPLLTSWSARKVLAVMVVSWVGLASNTSTATELIAAYASNTLARGRFDSLTGSMNCAGTDSRT